MTKRATETVISETMYIFSTCFALSPDPEGTGRRVFNSFSGSHVAGIRALSPVCLSPGAAASFSVSGAGAEGPLFHFSISR